LSFVEDGVFAVKKASFAVEKAVSVELLNIL
jgi:hypothetical protein